MSPGLSTSDDTLPLINPAVPNTGNTLAMSAAQSTGNAGNLAGSAPALAGTPSGAVTGGSFFGTRGIAIILGLIFIGGSILLFLGDDIAGAVKIASQVSA